MYNHTNNNIHRPTTIRNWGDKSSPSVKLASGRIPTSILRTCDASKPTAVVVVDKNKFDTQVCLSHASIDVLEKQTNCVEINFGIVRFDLSSVSSDNSSKSWGISFNEHVYFLIKLMKCEVIGRRENAVDKLLEQLYSISLQLLFDRQQSDLSNYLLYCY